MNDTQSMLNDLADRILNDLCQPQLVNEAEQDVFPQALWDALNGAGLSSVIEGDQEGQVGNMLALLRSAGRHAVPVPLAETNIAGWLLQAAGIGIPSEQLSVAWFSEKDDGPAFRREAGGWTLRGYAEGVAWSVGCRRLVAVGLSSDDAVRVAIIQANDLSIREGRNLAGEPLLALTANGLHVDGASVVKLDRDGFVKMGAATRVALMAGALERVLDLSVKYVGERVQFGRPLGKFQAVQQQIALLAVETAAAVMCAEVLMDPRSGGDSWFNVASAKARVSEAAGTAARIAHQVHGAMGFTHEYPLHQYTRRLWVWREEYGNEVYWQKALGSYVIGRGGEMLWSTLVAQA
jgi:hypothetical protein